MGMVTNAGESPTGFRNRPAQHESSNISCVALMVHARPDEALSHTVPGRPTVGPQQMVIETKYLVSQSYRMSCMLVMILMVIRRI